MSKINRQGEFTPFPGVSVISSINSENVEFWQNIFNFLKQNPLITNHYSLLPVTSYHMTNYNLYVQNHTERDSWLTFIDKNLSFFHILKEHIELFLKFSPVIQCKRVITYPVLQIIVDILPEQKEQIEGIGAFFNLKEQIAYPFHITLGYQYKPLNESEQKQIGEELLAYLNTLSPHSVLSLQPPTLCYFNDMTSFVPWNGSVNPFRKNPSDTLDTSLATPEEKPTTHFSAKSNSTTFFSERNDAESQEKPRDKKHSL